MKDYLVGILTAFVLFFMMFAVMDPVNFGRWLGKIDQGRFAYEQFE